MSGNTLNAALRRLGYGKDEMTSHGFRGKLSGQSQSRLEPEYRISRLIRSRRNNDQEYAYYSAEAES
jgi:hypothetical protein